MKENIGYILIVLAVITIIALLLYWVSFIHISISIFIGALITLGIAKTLLDE